ncbi:hypothetical protein EV356DRAFT_527170 [Viridothelium virens]|uniref:t-SNARE coiled-coil homology domain-containing protein n=1 Tax=Viridothelium virens TaxID=1048519 RepID=A0A6A6GWE7_VIRVR|nr:hypothetical protein EV356DRAFT_527170 [Viridothelium virens]
MSSRQAKFNSHLHQRDARSALFSSYDSARTSPSSRPSSSRSANPGYGFPPPASDSGASGPAFGAYPGGSSSNGGTMSGGGGGMNGGGDAMAANGGFRSATPNKRGQYSDAVLNELESQNDAQVEGISAKVRMLKDLTVSIGDEIRDSTALAEKMNDSFDSTRVRLRGTMNRMLRMAERSGVSWKIWLAFFGAVILLFWYVWLF